MDPIATGSAIARESSPKSGRVPSLDGLRALSIGLVMLAHLKGTRGFLGAAAAAGDLSQGDFPGVTPAAAPHSPGGFLGLSTGTARYSHLGVVVFFVISGFLITRLLLAEYAKNGNISVKLFYARRALRLFPASYVFIACVSVLWLAGIVRLVPNDIWHAVTYTMNYYPGRSWTLGHLWSLSVEEQFYLLWPLVFLAMGPRRAIWVAAAVVLLGPVARTAAWLFLSGTPYLDVEMFPMVADSIATGCVLANISGWLEGQKWYLKLFHPACSLGLLALILLTNRFLGYRIVMIFGTSVINISLAILIHRSVFDSRDWIGHLLNWKPIVFIGVLSYSLYIWQELFLNRNSTAWMNAFPQNLVFAIAAALGSYLLLEKPLLRWRHRLRA